VPRIIQIVSQTPNALAGVLEERARRRANGVVLEYRDVVLRQRELGEELAMHGERLRRVPAEAARRWGRRGGGARGK
jgi:hypothetical protein